jgi:uncharacterized protein (TIGR01615 family)
MHFAKTCYISSMDTIKIIKVIPKHVLPKNNSYSDDLMILGAYSLDPPSKDEKINEFIPIDYHNITAQLKNILSRNPNIFNFLNNAYSTSIEVEEIIEKLRKYTPNLDIHIHNSSKVNDQYTFPCQSVIIHKRFVVIPNFTSYFKIYGETLEYIKLLECLPDTFIGNINSLKLIVNLICSQVIKQHYCNNKLTLPPWRYANNMIIMFLPKFIAS